nr:hypothetical protein [Tanacetum cinerariifolium]
MNEHEETEEFRDNADDAQVEGRQTDIYHIDMDHATKSLSIETVSAAAVVSVAVPETVSATAVVPIVTASPVKVVVPSTRQKRGVVIWDLEEESSAKTPTETKSKDKGKEPVTAVDDVEDQSIQSPTPPTLPPQQPQDIPSTSQAQSPPPQRVEHLEHDKKDEPEVQEAVEVVTTAKLITEVVADVSESVSAASTNIADVP